MSKMTFFREVFPSLGEEGWIYCTSQPIGWHKMSELPLRHRLEVFGDCLVPRGARAAVESILDVSLSPYYVRGEGCYRFPLGTDSDSEGVYMHASDLDRILEIPGVSFDEWSDWYGYINFDADVLPEPVMFQVGENADEARYEVISDPELVAKLGDFVASMRLVGIETTPESCMIDKEWVSDQYPGWRATSSVRHEEQWYNYIIEGVEA